MAKYLVTIEASALIEARNPKEAWETMNTAIEGGADLGFHLRAVGSEVELYVGEPEQVTEEEEN